MITLITGQPGHGKTLRALQLALAERKAGREVYACRIRGLDFAASGFHELDKLETWEQLPDGSVIVVDECYEDIPARGQGKAMPEWEKNLATHRHRGFDFIFICQIGGQISTFVRGLVNKHVHVRRKFGFHKAVLLEWDRYQAAVSSSTEIKNGTIKAWSYPKAVFGIYKSAEVHTSKRALPFRIVVLPFLVVAVVGLIWWATYRLTHKEVPGQKQTVGAAAPAARTAGGQQAADAAAMTPAQYVTNLTPRVTGMPWSAPWHDGEKPKAKPDVLCVASEVKGCRCYTEQITPINVPTLQCYEIAKHGIYNPFREPLPRVLGGDRREDAETGVRFTRDSEAAAAPKALGASYEPMPLPNGPTALALAAKSLR
jgi:zona occludens toxin (predicted ATPase)